MDQAAAMLGMTVEKLTELRSNNEIFGYRDGQNWKFKMSELERVASDLDIQLKDASSAPLDLGDIEDFELSDSALDISSADLSESLTDKADDMGILSGGGLGLGDSGEFSLEDSAELSLEDSAELSLEDSAELSLEDSAELSLEDSAELSLGDSGLSLGDSGLSLGDSGLSLEDSGDLTLENSGLSIEDSGSLSLADSADDLLLEGDSVVLGSEDVLDGDDDDDLSFGSSDISLAASSKDLPSPSDTNALLAGGSNLLDEELSGGQTPSDTGMMLAAADSLDDDDDDDLFGDDLELIDDDSFEESADLGSDFEDSDLVLDDSDSSAEIVLAGGESGINLGLNESGIELDEEPLELGGSDIDSLELPEDDDDLLELDALDDSGTMAQEDEFKLTALEEDLDDQSSGSQVIALEDSEIYDDGEASILGSDVLGAQPAMLPEAESAFGSDTGGSIFDQAGMSPEAGVVAGGAMVAPAGVAGVPAAAVETPFTIWQVIGLGLVATLLVLGGMLGYDIARNLWMPEDTVISTGLLKFFLEITGMG